MATAGMRKSTSINDYPEHLNPFRDDERLDRLRFWTLTKKPGRRSSFSLNNINIKDFRNTWSLKSFMKKSKKGQESQTQSHNVADKTSNGEPSRDPSPVVFRRAMQHDANPERATMTAGDRYVYRGSVTPLPRSRFQERLRSTPPSSNEANNFTHLAPGRASFSHRAGDPYALPGLTRSEAGGSRVSVTTVGSTNPFEDEPAQPLVPARRKKKRAAPLPPSLDASAVSENTLETTVETMETVKKDESDILNDPTLKVELKIIEDLETKKDVVETKPGQTEATVTPPVDAKVEEIASTNGTKEAPIEVQVSNNESVKMATPASSKLANNDIPTPINENSPKSESVNRADLKNNNTEEATEVPNSPVKLRTTKSYSVDSDNRDVRFDKVDIRVYRRNSSQYSDSINGNGDTVLSPKRSMSLTNTNPIFTTFSTSLHIDEEEKDVNDNQAPQRVVCKLLVTDRPRKGSIDNSASSTEKEFIEIDKTTRELEQELQRLSKFKYIDDVSPRKSNGTNPKGERNSVADIRSRFENPAIYSPNPIPKPRRTRAGSESPVRQQ